MKNRIKTLRMKRQMTQMDLANELNLSRSTIAGYETGNSVPDVATLVQMAKVLDTTVDYMTGESDDPDFSVSVTDVDPQILEIMKYCKRMNAQGIQLVVEYADVLSSSGRYPKKPLR